MNRIHPLNETRRTIRWPMMYGNAEFIANGMVLDVAETEWRIAGPILVRPGMCLNVWVWPPKRPEGLLLEDARVLWVDGFKFGLDVPDTYPVDSIWITTHMSRGSERKVVPRAA